MKATDKHPTIDSFLSNLMGGKDRHAVVANGECMTCANTEVKFRDEPSRDEYLISGMCQPCQDDVFGVSVEVEPWK
jgi:hypothetical protein